MGDFWVAWPCIGRTTHGTWAASSSPPELRGRHVGTALLETALTDIFAQDIREVTMEARDTTVHILKKFGAETTGAPFSFYRGTVTPMRLTREAFWNSHTGGQI